MRGAWPVPQIREAEAALMARLPDGALMARAAFALSVEAARLIGFTYGARVGLLVGRGDNGGDALFAGALLARRGAQVRAVLAEPGRAHEHGLAALRSAGGLVVELDDLGDADLLIDGLLGIGAAGPLREFLVPIVQFANTSSAPVLAVDLPSGISPTTGEVPGDAIRATVTLCMGALKPGLLVGDGRNHCGRIEVVDIGLSSVLPSPDVYELDESDVASLVRPPTPEDEKYTRGVVGIAAGSKDYPGAAVLTTGAARLSGVGVVRYAGPVMTSVVAAFPDVVVCPTVASAGPVQAWVLGPGFGTSPEAEMQVETIMSTDVPLVLDADGLNIVAKRRELLDHRTAPTIITPHTREFERLFGELGTDRFAAARRAAREAGCTVLLKGFATIVAEPSGRCFVNPTGHPALATAGSGDVLAGLVGGLLATNVEPALAAAGGAWVHGRAAAVASEGGPVTASDLHDAVRQVLASLR